jgi:hypothetical protein
MTVAVIRARWICARAKPTHLRRRCCRASRNDRFFDGKLRIIGINGVWCDRNPVWNNLETAFRQRFHVSDFVIEEEMKCEPTGLGPSYFARFVSMRVYQRSC